MPIHTSIGPTGIGRYYSVETVARGTWLARRDGSPFAPRGRANSARTGLLQRCFPEREIEPEHLLGPSQLRRQSGKADRTGIDPGRTDAIAVDPDRYQAAIAHLSMFARASANAHAVNP